MRCECFPEKEAVYLNHFEEHAPCGPRRMNLSEEAHSDLLGHALTSAKEYIKRMSGGVQTKVPYRIVWRKSRRVLFRCIKCERITQDKLYARIRELCKQSGIENWEEIAERLISDLKKLKLTLNR